MIVVTWMAYAALFTALLAVTGGIAEAIARACGAPSRFVWLVALAVAVAMPTALAFRTERASITSSVAQRQSPLVRSTSRANPTMHTPLQLPVSSDDAWSRVTSPSRDRRTLNVDRYAVAVWLLSSALLLTLFVIAALRLRVRSRTWEVSSVDGVSVLVSPDVGPAVIGAVRSRIVLPAWTLTLDNTKRALLLRHEIEYIRARDPLLLHLASFAVVLAPWNVALWFIARRLRHSIELDCDRRVLGATPLRDDVARDYGMLLLLVGGRRAVGFALSTGFSTDRTSLERRIKAMTTRRSRRPTLLSFGLTAVATGAMIVVTYAPLPASLRSIPPRRYHVLTQVKQPPPTPASSASAASAHSPSEALLNVDTAATLPPLRLIDTNGATTRDESVGARVRIPVAVQQQSRVTSRVATGRVVDSMSNAPLPNVYVSVIGIQALGEKNWTCTDGNGDFELRVPVGEAWISARAADHAFARVILGPADSIALLRGTYFKGASQFLTFQHRIAGITAAPIRARDPLIIVDGVPQPPDSARLALRSGTGAAERDVRRGDPKIYVDGQEVTASLALAYSNPCATK